MKLWQKRALLGVLILFALIGFAFSLVFAGMQFGAFNVRGANEARNESLQTATTSAAVQAVQQGKPCVDPDQKTCAWNETPEWAVVAGGLGKDAALIARVSSETGVDARMVAAAVVPEQMRFFVSNREVFKRYFEPLKILGSLTKFSLGVSGIKQETAARIEQYANDPASPFYPGEGYAALIAYPEGADHDAVLYARLADDKDHYYAYLYTALYLKEITMQWQRAGYDVAHDPEVLVTLFNIGFDASHPNPAPRAAGAVISAGGKSYSFGQLGALFYSSEELKGVL